MLALAATGAGVYYYFNADLPSVEELRGYTPPQVTKVLCAGGSRCAEFYRERRTWVPLSALPAHVKNAFLAAEDAGFYQHEGLDFLGMARAGLMGLIPGRRMTGASTISQQACRNLLLSQERTLARKIREWILTPRMEKALTKDKILELYVNFVYFGHGRFGVEEAALFYFGKSARALSLGEAAVLAGIVQSPNWINPLTNIRRAKQRQRYVLEQLEKHQFAPKAQIAGELEKPITLGPRPPAQVGAYYAEEVRKALIERYGEKTVLEGGLTVEIAMDARLQGFAEQAVRSGLEAVDRRQGYRGPLGQLEPARFAALRPLLVRRLEEAGKRRPEERLVADLGALASAPPVAPAVAPEDSEENAASPDEALAALATMEPLREGLRLGGYVAAVDDAKGLATIDLIGKSARLSVDTAAWARPRKQSGSTFKLSQVLSTGTIVLVRVGRLEPLEVELDQLPAVQGALVAINPANRHVVAMVGGYDFERSAFNRATQAQRQPGSSFKPFLYAAALASGRYTPLSIVNDAPEAIRDPWTGKTWKPQNYERGGFEGPMSLRSALTRSKNTVSVRLIEALTPQVVIDFARKAGISSVMPDNLTLALGTGEVRVLEIANAYATLHSLGRHAQAVQILKVTDASGKVLEERQAAFEEAFPAPIAFLTTSLMRSVVEEGTATQVQELNRPAAGKTGTAQEFRDAWFSGYTAHLVATSWVGFDDHSSLGSGETGGKAALPLWLSFMKAAHEEIPISDFEAPTGITFARIDPATGLLAGGSVPGRLEPFLDGTAPTTEAPPPNQVHPSDFFLDEGRSKGL